MATIYSLETDGLVWYVGSTINVVQRRSEHKIRRTRGSRMIPTEFEFEFKILEENVEVEQRYIRERYWYDTLMPLVNEKIPGTSHLESNKRWRKANPERVKKHQHDYYLKKKALTSPPSSFS